MDNIADYAFLTSFPGSSWRAESAEDGNIAFLDPCLYRANKINFMRDPQWAVSLKKILGSAIRNVAARGPEEVSEYE